MRLIFLLLTFLLLATNAHTQIRERELILNGTYNSLSMQVLDINGDGKPDLTGSGKTGFEAYLNKGNFLFTSSGVFNIPLTPQQLSSGDFTFIDYDGDHDQDLLFVDCGGCAMNTFHLFENVDGTTFVFKEKLQSDFKAHTNIYTAVADFDNDGDQDFMSSGGFLHDAQIYYFRNDNTQFTSFNIDTFGTIGVSAVVAMDLTQDGKPEFVAFGENHMLYVYKNLGGTFNQPVAYAGGEFILRTKDINNDGTLDLYYESGTCIKIMLAENGGFAAPVTYFCGTVQEGGYYLSDADGDGDLDIYHGGTTRSGLFVKENINNVFQPSRQISVTGYQDFYITEFDADGDALQDLLVFSYEKYLGTLERISTTGFGLTHTIASSLSMRNISAYQITSDAAKEISVFYDDWVGYIDPEGNDYQGVHTVYSSSMFIEDVVYADLDQDNDQDMVLLFNAEVTSNIDSSVIWLQNDNQVFSHPRLVLGDYTDGKKLLIHDFDKDGDLDMAVFSDFQNGKYLKNTNGTFAAQVLNGTSWEASIYDMNGDGWDDILTWDYNKFVLVHENDKAGGFKTVVNVNTDNAPRRCVAFDFDHDQDLDIVVSDFNTGVTVYKKNTNSYSKVFNKTTGNDYTALAAVDQVLDGKTGILFGADVTYYRDWGNFTFLTWQHYFPDAYYRQMWFNDFDQSGSAELVGYGDGGLWIHREAQQVIDDDMDGYFTDVDCNDFDTLINPGVLEIPNNLVDENCDGIVLIIDVDGDGFNSDIDCNDQDSTIHPMAIEIPGNSIDENCDGLDVFGDGDMDGYASDVDCNDQDPKISPGAFDIPLNTIDEDCDGADAISYFTKRTRLFFDYPVVDVDAADFDGDGLKDVLYTSHQLIGWVSYEHPGGPASGFVHIDNEAAYTHAEAGDFDKDGDMDVVGAADNWNTITLFRNDGHGNFDGGVKVDSLASVLDMSIGDIDGDGNLDIAAAFYGGTSHKPSIYFGDGNGGFTEIKPITENANVFPKIFVYDIDGDHDLDLFISTQLTGMGWYENTGNRLFSTRRSICDLCPVPVDLFHVDYDHDGVKELIYYVSGATVGDIHPGIRVYDYHNGNITYRHLIIQHDVLGRIYPQDMNGDCRLDFVWGGLNFLRMGIAYNYDEVPFPEHRMTDTSLHILDIIAEDLNGDGNPEMILGTTTRNTVTIIRNDFPPKDTDEDGADQMSDCAYCDPTIHPGATEIPGNGIDENCDGLDLVTDVENSSSLTFKIYPNPTNGKIYIETNTADLFSVSVFNGIGQPVMKNIHDHEIDLTGMPSGIYMILVESGLSMRPVVKRIVLQR